MRAMLEPSVKHLGLWSAVSCSALSLFYIVGQLAEWLGWLGSDGGPESASTPLGIVILLVPSLLLGTAFVVLMVSVHHAAAPERRVWAHAAVAFAGMYAVLTGTVYYVQLTFVMPHMLGGDMAGMEGWVFEPFDSYFYSVDILGYSFMSLATLFAAGVFTGDGLQRTARRFLVANGLLIPFLVFQIQVHSLIWVAALWAVTFPGATITLARLFARAETPAGREAETSPAWA